jgi:hypothetical protein
MCCSEGGSAGRKSVMELLNEVARSQSVKKLSKSK